MMVGVLRAFGSWLKENATGIFLAILTIIINYPRLHEILRPVWVGVQNFLGAVAPVLLVVFVIGTVFVLGWLATRVINRAVWPFIDRVARGVRGFF